MRREFNLPRSELERLIHEWIFSERDRAMLARRLLDGRTYEQLAEEFGLSPRHVQRIIHKSEDIFFRHLPAR